MVGLRVRSVCMYACCDMTYMPARYVSMCVSVCML